MLPDFLQRPYEVHEVEWTIDWNISTLNLWGMITDDLLFCLLFFFLHFLHLGPMTFPILCRYQFSYLVVCSTMLYILLYIFFLSVFFLSNEKLWIFVAWNCFPVLHLFLFSPFPDCFPIEKTKSGLRSYKRSKTFFLFQIICLFIAVDSRYHTSSTTLC